MSVLTPLEKVVFSLKISTEKKTSHKKEPDQTERFVVGGTYVEIKGRTGTFFFTAPITHWEMKGGPRKEEFKALNKALKKKRLFIFFVERMLGKDHTFQSS